MGIIDRREREKEQRRNAIIDAAEKLFSSKGVANTTMDEVAEMVELSKGTLYLYFKNKEELFCAIVQRGLDILEKNLIAASEKGNDALEKLHSMSQAYFSFCRQFPFYFSVIFYHEFHQMVFAKEDETTQEILNQGQRMYDWLGQVMEEGKAQGCIRPDVDPLLTAFSLHAFMSGLVRIVLTEKDHLLDHHRVDGEKLAEYAFDLIRRSLQK